MTSTRSNFDRINDKNLEQCVVTFLEKVDSMEKSKRQTVANTKALLPASAELRTLELWRSIISECLASFLYVFIVCGAKATTARDGSFPHTSFVTAAASGFTMTVLTYCFQHLSGGHVNPATTVSMAVTRRISPTRGLLFVSAQVGGGVAGAALLFGVSLPSNYGSISATLAEIPSKMLLWEKFCIEFVLTFLVVFTYCGTIIGHHKWLGSSPICVGFAYLSACLVASPTLNPARAFGPAFVMNSWDHHWIFWLAPCSGGITAALVHEIIFCTHKRKCRSDMSADGDSISIHSDADTYDELEKQRASTIRSIRGADSVHRQIVTHSGNSYCTSLYPIPAYKMERTGDPIYEGSRSLYTRSPPLTRANLNRSQSVYAKSTNNGVPLAPIVGDIRYAAMPHRESFRQTNAVSGGPLISTGGGVVAQQSAYSPMPSGLGSSNPSNQNHQNQQKQGAAESFYGGATAGGRDIYMKHSLRGGGDPIYMKKQQQRDSNESAYGGSYHSSNGSAASKPGVAAPIHQCSSNNNNNARKESHATSSHQTSYYHRGQQSPAAQY